MATEDVAGRAMYVDAVLYRTRRRIDLFEQAGDDWRYAESLKSITEDTAQEYEGRALYELIQNGFDALGEKCRGRITIRFDADAEEHGCLYVANDGAPFTDDNFKAITEFALSDKAAGEGIGNKGLGFRSVLQLTDWPEIFSKHQAESETFDGFCFRFATPGDLVELLEDDARAAKVAAKVSPLALPLPAEVTDPIVKEFAEDGYATVVRLPLRNLHAMEAVAEQFKALLDKRAPVLLFLDRLTQLRLVWTDPEGASAWALTRTEQPFGPLADVAWISEVNLGEGGRFLVAAREVDGADMAAAVEESIEGRAIDEKWASWNGQATVSIALDLDTVLQAGRMYTFLPMSDTALSPFPGHVHAPFFTKLARLDLSEAVPLNDFLYDEIAWLAKDLLVQLTTLSAEALPAGMTLDLVCWDPADRLIDAFSEAGTPLEDVPLVPVFGDSRWGTMASAFQWDPDQDHQVMTPQRLSSVGVSIVDPDTPQDRLGSLERLHERLLERSMKPEPEEVADWAENVAARLPPPEGEGLETWAEFYDDLASIFDWWGKDLRARRIIVDQQGLVVSALGGDIDTSDSTIFFAPGDVHDEEGTARLPSGLRALQRRIRFTNPDIPWTLPGNPPRRRPGRRFLAEAQLVREYRTDRVFDALDELLRGSSSPAFKRDALLFAYRQFGSLNDTQRSQLRERRLFVPTASGQWLRARDSLFHPAWGSPDAVGTERLLSLGGETFAELAQTRNSWISPPDEWPHRIDGLDGWRDFLSAIGVGDGLPPDRLDSCLNAVSDLGSRARAVFALLVLHGLQSWDEIPSDHGLRAEPWIPVRDHAGSDAVSFVRPNEAWYGIDHDVPPFVPALLAQFRRDVQGRAFDRLQEYGLRIWGDPRHGADAIRELGVLLETGEVPDHLAARFQRAYRDAWANAADLDLWPWSEGDDPCLAVTLSLGLAAIRISETERLFVADTADPLKESLLEAADFPVLIAPHDHDSFIAFLTRNGVEVTTFSDATTAMHADGVPVVPSGHHPRLADLAQWLPILIGLIAELRPDRAHRRSEKTARRMMTQLRSIRVIHAHDVDVLIEGVHVDTTTGVRSLPVADDASPTIVVWNSEPGWDLMQAAAPAICQSIGQPDLQPALELTLMKLRYQLGEEPPTELTDDSLAAALGRPLRRIVEIRRGLVGDLLDLVVQLQPAIVTSLGIDRIDEITGALSSLQSEAALRSLLDQWRADLKWTPQRLISAARQAPSLGALRDKLGLGFADFNNSLRALGGTYEPITHPDRHDIAFDTFVNEHVNAIRERLREVYAPRAHAGEDVSGYVDGRRLQGLTRDDAWLQDFDEPSVELLRSRVSEWLSQHGADTDLDRPAALPALDDLRRDNFKRLDDVLTLLRARVRAWCRHNAQPVPIRWTDAPAMLLKGALESTGLADLVPVGEETIIALSVTALGWPNGMPTTTDLTALGLRAGDLVEPPTDDGTGPPSPRPPKTINLAGVDLPVGVESFAQLAEATHRSLDDAFLDQIGTTQLGQRQPTIRASSRSAQTRPLAVAASQHMTEDQRTAIGLVGEVAARAWLERRYSSIKWCSGYANLLTGDEEASDSLGYDFEIPRAGTSLYYEVKALVAYRTDTVELHMEESQLRVAQACAGGNRYRLLVVTAVLDPPNRQIFELPSPFSRKGAGHYRVIGQGLRYRCSLRTTTPKVSS